MINDLKKICESKTFESIFHLYAKDLRKFIFFKTQDFDVAEDILQDTFVTLWNNCDKVSYHKVKSYIYTVANNTFLNIKKHEKVVHKHQQNHLQQVSYESPEFIMLEKEYLDKIEEAIASLTDKQREVFLMSRIEKMKYKEIATQLNISVKAVEKRMHQALIVMKDKIGNV